MAFLRGVTFLNEAAPEDGLAPVYKVGAVFWRATNHRAAHPRRLSKNSPKLKIKILAIPAYLVAKSCCNRLQ